MDLCGNPENPIINHPIFRNPNINIVPIVCNVSKDYGFFSQVVRSDHRSWTPDP